MERTENLNVQEMKTLISPDQLKAGQPLTEPARQTVLRTRQGIREILQGHDDRLLAIVGPCSIHDPDAALEYATRLSRLSRRLGNHLCLVMRTYFEKPRTTVGWRGLVNDPYLDGSCDTEEGLRTARRLLLQINELGLGTATEFLEPIVPQYLCDLVSWCAVGARTTESQTHREMASGLSMPVGFKNSTDGNLTVAADAMVACRAPHSFLGIDNAGRTAVIHTSGNPWVHMILRGGRNGPNYTPEGIEAASRQLGERGLPVHIMVDCSHANSGRQPVNQARVLDAVMRQARVKGSGIMGFMLESNLVEGRQDVTAGRTGLTYGQSITDACCGWEETEAMLQRTCAA